MPPQQPAGVVLVVVLVVVLGVVCDAAKYWPPHVDVTRVNQNWRSTGCDHDHHGEAAVFASLRYALRSEYRELSLALWSGWMDRYQAPLQRVAVTCVSPAALELSSPPAPSPALESQEPDTEELHAIFVLSPPTQAPAPAEEGPETGSLAAVDGFLVRNPCWVVLKDAHSAAAHSSNSTTTTTAAGAARRHRGGAPTGYASASILLRLPARPFGATCKLFTAITARQFPATTCPPASGQFLYVAQNFGFGGESNKIVKTFGYTLASSVDRVYAKPVGDHYKWSWADGTGAHCSTALAASDPWACTFLPLSNCSFPLPAPREGDAGGGGGGVDTMSHMSKGWGEYSPGKETEHKFLDKIGINGAMLTALGDGGAVSSEPATWVQLRLYAFLLRPTLRTRQLMRRALDHRIVRLLPAQRKPGAATTQLEPHAVPVALLPLRRSEREAASHPSSSSTAATAVSTDDQQQQASLASSVTSGEPIAAGRCLGLHVRNADVLTDWRSGRAVDRSLNAHVFMSLNLSTSLALHDVFLATDNASLLYIAPIEYPQYRWFAQVRPIRPLDEQMKRGALHHVHESEPAKEIANLLVDALLVGRCEAFVGQGDGSVTLFYHMFSCNLANAASACPPMVDLQWISEEGSMPYVGKRAGPATFASFGRRQ